MRQTTLVVKLGDDEARQLLGLDKLNGSITVEYRAGVMRELAKELVNKALPQDIREEFDAAVEARVKEVLGEWSGRGHWDRKFVISNPTIIEALESRKKKAINEAVRAVKATVEKEVSEEAVATKAEAWSKDIISRHLKAQFERIALGVFKRYIAKLGASIATKALPVESGESS